jgi:hypothetical protein
VAEIQCGIAAVERRSPPAPVIEQTPAQRTLEQAQSHQHFAQRGIALPGLPARFDLPQPFQHHFVVASMRPSMHRQPHPHCGFFGAGQKQAIAAKIVKSQSVRANSCDQA